MSNVQVLEGQVVEQFNQPQMNVNDLFKIGSIFCKLKENYFNGYYEVYYIIVKVTDKFVTAKPLNKDNVKMIKDEGCYKEFSFTLKDDSTDPIERFGKTKLSYNHFTSGNGLYEFNKEYTFTKDKNY